MGLFDSFFNREQERTLKKAYRREDFPVQLVKPSTGRIVELQVTTKDAFIASLYKRQLETYAKSLENDNVKWKFINENTLHLIFANDNMADITRQVWDK